MIESLKVATTFRFTLDKSAYGFAVFKFFYNFCYLSFLTTGYDETTGFVETAGLEEMLASLKLVSFLMY